MVIKVAKLHSCAKGATNLCRAIKVLTATKPNQAAQKLWTNSIAALKQWDKALSASAIASAAQEFFKDCYQFAKHALNIIDPKYANWRHVPYLIGTLIRQINDGSKITMEELNLQLLHGFCTAFLFGEMELFFNSSHLIDETFNALSCSLSDRNWVDLIAHATIQQIIMKNDYNCHINELLDEGMFLFICTPLVDNDIKLIYILYSNVSMVKRTV